MTRAASVAILPSALFYERYSLGASWVFSFQWCCYLIIDLFSHLFGGSRAPGLSRSHLDSAVELGSSYSIRRHGAYLFPVLISFIAGLLSVALRARRPLGAYRIPPQTGLLIPSDKRCDRKLAHHHTGRSLVEATSRRDQDFHRGNETNSSSG